MTMFNSIKREETMDELDKKIGSMNAYLVDGRTEVERLKKDKADFVAEVSVQEHLVEDRTLQALKLQEEVDTRSAAKQKLDEDIIQCKNNLLLENTKLDNARKMRGAEEEKIKSTIADIEKQRNDFASEKSALLVFSKSLEEKEKKLDEYAAKMNRFVDSLKKS